MLELRGAELCIAGLGVLVIGKMLGHTQAVTTARYAHFICDLV